MKLSTYSIALELLSTTYFPKPLLLVPSFIYSVGVFPTSTKINFTVQLLLCKSNVELRKTSIFWDITRCDPLKVNRRFRGTCCLQYQGRKI
jgi:hypothetical protein